MESNLNLPALFSEALRSGDYTEYYAALAEATSEELWEFETDWKDAAVSDESLKQLEDYRQIVDNYSESPGAHQFSFDFISRDLRSHGIMPIHKEIVEKLFNTRACPACVNGVCRKMWLAEGPGSYSNMYADGARNLVVSMTPTEFDILLLIEAQWRDVSKPEARQKLAKLLKLDLDEV